MFYTNFRCPWKFILSECFKHVSRICTWERGFTSKYSCSFVRNNRVRFHLREERSYNNNCWKLPITNWKAKVGGAARTELKSALIELIVLGAILLVIHQWNYIRGHRDLRAPPSGGIALLRFEIFTGLSILMVNDGCPCRLLIYLIPLWE